MLIKKNSRQLWNATRYPPSTGSLAGAATMGIIKIDAALAANRALDPNIRNVIQTRRDTGERLQNAGRHQDSVRTLAGAKQMLTKLGVKVD